MNTVKNQFSIKDLENLSGIKAHTIRIWEKRYNLLTPERTDTNIRYYPLCNLQKLLNITLLYNNGYKISKIAEIPEDKIPLIAKEIVSNSGLKDQSINDFKLAMLNFDYVLFTNTYNNLLSTKTFQETFYDIFIPLLNELGLLWQTNTITPAHEHFITGLIKQKIILNTEKVQNIYPTNDSKVFVLYLPENEIHEIGLLFLNYEIIKKGYQSIYLGQTVPMNSLKDLLKYYSNITFISYFTVEPSIEKLDAYISNFDSDINSNTNNELWILGNQANKINKKTLPIKVKTFNSIIELTDKL